MIIMKTYDEKAVIYHKLGSDGGALVMMCARDEESQPSATPTEKLLWLVYVTRLWTHVINSEN
jgi:hypothetical protein